MNTYIVLIRGINVGGKNKVSMADLKRQLENRGYTDIRTYINSGNVILTSNKSKPEIKSDIESQLPKWFRLNDELIKVLVISKDDISAIVQSKPSDFGEEPLTYHSDVIFLMDDVSADQAFSIFSPKEGVDQVWKGEAVIYSQRFSAERTKSQLNKIMSSPLYKSMTVRNWNTTMKLYTMVNSKDAGV